MLTVHSRKNILIASNDLPWVSESLGALKEDSRRRLFVQLAQLSALT